METEKAIIDEMQIMLKVFDGVIITDVMPAIESPCHDKVKELIKRANDYLSDNCKKCYKCGCSVTCEQDEIQG